jgi:hypothetical protein
MIHLITILVFTGCLIYVIVEMPKRNECPQESVKTYRRLT